MAKFDPQAWLADRIADTQRDRELLPWKWKKGAHTLPDPMAKIPAVHTEQLAKERDFRTSEWSACVQVSRTPA